MLLLLDLLLLLRCSLGLLLLFLLHTLLFHLLLLLLRLTVLVGGLDGDDLRRGGDFLDRVHEDVGDDTDAHEQVVQDEEVERRGQTSREDREAREDDPAVADGRVPREVDDAAARVGRHSDCRPEIVVVVRGLCVTLERPGDLVSRLDRLSVILDCQADQCHSCRHARDELDSEQLLTVEPCFDFEWHGFILL